MRIVLIVGDDGSVQQALGELTRQAFAETGCGPAMVLTATADVDVWKVLCRPGIDLIVANYNDDGRGADMLTWMTPGTVRARTVLVTRTSPGRNADDWLAKGIHAVLPRPATLDGLKTLITRWFPGHSGS